MKQKRKAIERIETATYETREIALKFFTSVLPFVVACIKQPGASVEKISKELGITHRQASMNLLKLEENGYVEVIREKRSNSYRWNFERVLDMPLGIEVTLGEFTSFLIGKIPLPTPPGKQAGKR